MSYLHEKVAYLKGLADGLQVDDSSKEGKLLLQIIEVLDAFAEDMEDVYDELDDMSDAIEELDEYVDAIDEDLSDLEEDLYEDDDLDEEYEEVECPACGETVLIESQILDKDDTVECPNCGATIDLFELVTDEDAKESETKE
jgi:DNA-directed RNA polymerase subunit RPC12/RpoP